MYGKDAPSVESLLVHEGLVRGIARAVLHGDGREDDVAQDTWEKALHQGPRDDDAMRGWLARVAHRLALMIRRGDASRGRRETVVAGRSAPVPSVAEVVEREETRRRVLDALLALDAPDRDTLLLRYYEGLAPREIAARIGVPVETVRTRVKRGLERLRTELVGPASKRDHRVLSILAFGIGGPPPPRGTGVIAGGALMSAKSVGIAASVVVALTVGAFLAFSGRTSPSAPTMASVAPRVDVGTNDEQTLLGRSVAGTRREPADVPLVVAAMDSGSVVVARGTPFHVTVEGLSTSDVSGARLEVRGIGVLGDSPTLVVVGAPTSEGGLVADVGPLLAGTPRVVEFQATVDHPDYMPTTVLVAATLDSGGARPAGGYAATVRLVRAGILTGRVVDEAGGPVQSAFVAVYDSSSEPTLARVVDAVSTSNDGAFRLRVGAEGRYLVVAEGPGALPAWSYRVARPGESVGLGDLVARAGVALRGRVVSASLPVGSLVVVARGEWKGRTVVRRSSRDGRGELSIGDVGVSPWIVEVPTDAEGRFAFTGLEAGRYSVSVKGRRDVHLHQQLTETLARDVVVPALDVALGVEAARFRVHVERDGMPAAGVNVDLELRGTYAKWSDEAGMVEFFVSPNSVHRLKVSVDAFEPIGREITSPAAGRTEPVDVTLVPRALKAMLVVRLELPSGVEVFQASFRLFSAAQSARRSEEPPESPTVSRSAPLVDGRFVLTDVPPGRWRVVVRADGAAAPLLGAEATVDIPTSGEVAASIPLRLGGRLRIAARRADGSLVPASCRVIDDQGTRRSVMFLMRFSEGSILRPDTLSDTAPAVVEPALEAGAYTVEIEHPGYEPVTRQVRLEIGKTADLDVTLVKK